MGECQSRERSERGTTSLTQLLSAEEEPLRLRVDRPVLQHGQPPFDMTDLLVLLAVQPVLLAVRETELHWNSDSWVSSRRRRSRLRRRRFVAGIVVPVRVGLLLSAMLLDLADDRIATGAMCRGRRLARRPAKMRCR